MTGDRASTRWNANFCDQTAVVEAALDWRLPQGETNNGIRRSVNESYVTSLAEKCCIIDLGKDHSSASILRCLVFRQVKFPSRFFINIHKK
mmetsp:Transcript_117730/g.175855  ORF Transcript_117730/g.175855 Transcript_117730/m.175855 type:complete len:91 (+) Transcript_117730:953-1225(+)